MKKRLDKIKLADKVLCTGCGSCAMTCPCQCITMVEDGEGFLYPHINNKNCISCRMCEKSCPILLNKDIEKTFETNSYAAQNKNDDIRRKSSSGGVFFALASAVMNQEGFVCAAKYSEKFKVIHDITKIEAEIVDYCGAKYAQSDMGKCYERIKNILCQNQKVLFVGTPCQTAGLKAFLKRPYENLLLVDMICHGVPSPLVWKAYLDERKQKDVIDSEIVSVNLRDKSTGWSQYRYSVCFGYQNAQFYSIQQDKDEFMQGFISNLYLRPSCSNCKFKGIERCSDITLGDCWGIWNQHPEFDDNKGSSLVMIHSEKGSQIWDSISENFKILEISNEEAVEYNPSAMVSSKASDKREEFFKGFQQGKSICELVKFCLSNQDKGDVSIIHRVWNKLGRLITKEKMYE